MAARRLDDFNTEFGSPTPGAAVLAERLRRMLTSEQTRAWLGWQDPGGAPDGVALVTRRPNVWWDGPVDAPDADARRFYRRQGFQEIDPETGDHALLLWHQI